MSTDRRTVEKFSVLSEIDKTRFPFLEKEFEIHFFNDKFIATDIFLMDIWWYYGIHPNTLLAKLESLLCMLGNEEKFDLTLKLWSNRIYYEAGLLDFSLEILTNKRSLGKFYLDVPKEFVNNPNLIHDAWEMVLLHK